MKKLKIITLMALFAISCNNDKDNGKETPKHDVTFAVRLLVDEGEDIPPAVLIGIFQDLEYNLVSSATVISGQYMIQLNTNVHIKAEHFFGWFEIFNPNWNSANYEYTTFSSIEQGYYFVAIAVVSFDGVQQFGYRRLFIDNNTASDVQRFIFCNLTESRFVFIEM